MSPRVNVPELFARAEKARRLSSPCRLCPRRCMVDRVRGDRGFCKAGIQATVSAAFPHFGEEPPLTGDGGAGTIFFSGCNLGCVYCQNHQISQGGLGDAVDPQSLARMMLELRDKGCATIEPVSPSQHLPGLLEALAIAVSDGLDLPIVYNTNAYEPAHTLDLLDGVVDVYLPDLKYASNGHAATYSGVDNYVETARAAIERMHDQVGNLVVDLSGTAVRGLIVRHLILPDNVSGAQDSLRWIAEHLPRTVTVSLMAQYSPQHKSSRIPPLDKRISVEEYDRAVDLAWELGLENAFVQDFSSQDIGVPDFRLDNPIRWE